MTDNYDSELIHVNKLIDTEIKTSIITLDSTGQNNIKHKTSEISFFIEEANKAKNGKDNKKFMKKVEIDESALYNLQYKMKSAINQISDVVKTYGHY